MSGPERLPLLTFRLADQHYALRIGHVLEVAAMVQMETIANAHDAVLGMANRHGEPIVMLDLRILFGFSAIPIDINTLFIVAQTHDTPIGLVVDEIEQVRYVDSAALRPAQAAGAHITHLISNDAGRLFQLIDLDGLLNTFVDPRQL